MAPGTWMNVFLSYCRADSDRRARLDVHLAVLRRSGEITTWYDRLIEPGVEFDGEIRRHLEEAEIILLLVSPDFLASDYIHNVEMKRAFERQAENSARVIPVILRECDWKATDLRKLNALPDSGKPVTSFSNEDTPFHQVTEGLRTVINSLKAGQSRLTSSAAMVDPAEVKNPGRVEPSKPKTTFVLPATQATRERFSRDAYTTVINRFHHHHQAVLQENPLLSGDIEVLNSRSFTAVIYRAGRATCECRIWLGTFSGSEGLSYNDSRSPDRTHVNEWLTVIEWRGELRLNPSALNLQLRHPMTADEAARSLWDKFTAPIAH